MAEAVANAKEEAAAALAAKDAATEWAELAEAAEEEACPSLVALAA